MPIYEYQCSECGHQFDRLQKISDAPLVICPECNNESLTKLVSAPSFRLSGSGWYETDFKTDKDKKKNLAGDAGKASDKDSKSAEKSAEKPPKTENKPSKAANDSGNKSSTAASKSAQ